MPRVSEITSPGDNEILEKSFASEKELFGDLLNPTKILAHCPPILEAAKKFYASFEESGLLPGPLLALVYARVASLNGCPF